MASFQTTLKVDGRKQAAMAIKAFEKSLELLHPVIAVNQAFLRIGQLTCNNVLGTVVSRLMRVDLRQLTTFVRRPVELEDELLLFHLISEEEVKENLWDRNRFLSLSSVW
jgi:hypothetical protein